MTREEAIQVLQTALTAPFIYGEYADALNMAIKSLSAEPKTKCVVQIRIDRDDMEDFVNEKVNEIVDKMSEPKTGWIPVSERLPEKDGKYLICTNWDYPDMDVYRWADGWNCIRLVDDKVDREDEIDGANIIAWMPLPELYREDSEV